MPTIDVDIADDAPRVDYSVIEWFTLPNLVTEKNSPTHDELFSPSLALEVLSPPNVMETPSPPRLWENPPDPEKTHAVDMLRDCYLHEISSGLLSRTRQSLHILQHKTTSSISDDDITNIADNIIDSEILCSSLSDHHIKRIKKDITDYIIHSLSSSGVEEVVSTE